MSTVDKDTTLMMCAECGDTGGHLKTCNGCKLVKYCGAACQMAHRPAHKNDCKKRAAELLDIALFKQPENREECPICCLRLPRVESTYQLCCGKTLCNGCMVAVSADTDCCPFCREYPSKTNKGILKNINKRMEAGDAGAFLMLGSDYDEGTLGLKRDAKKAMELWNRAAKLGPCRASAMANYNIGCMYLDGDAGVPRDEKKAIKHYQQASIEGHEGARYNLAATEHQNGKMDRAMKHFMIAANAGHDASMKAVRGGYVKGHVTKDDLENTLRVYKESLDELNDAQREKAVKAILIDKMLGSSMTQNPTSWN